MLQLSSCLRQFLSPTPTPEPLARPIRLSIVTQFYPPDFAATGQYMEELATHLGQQGLDVHVFTGQPSYAYEVAEAPAKEQKGRVQITRSNFLRSRSRQIAGRTLSSLAFCLHSAWHLLCPIHRGDLILFVSEPPYLQTLGYLLKLIFGTAYACLVYDLYPDVVVGLNMLPERHWIVRLWDAINRRVWRQAERVIVPCQTMKDRMVAKHPELGPKITVIHNWSDADWIKPLAKTDNAFAQAQGVTETFTVLYSGNMGRCHDLDTVLGAAQALQGEAVQFLFIGGGPKRPACEQAVADLGLTNCRFLPYQDKALLPQSLTACDLHLVSVDLEMEGLVAPSKFYSSLASGRPVAIVCERHSYLRSLVSEAHCGAAFTNGDSQGLASFIRYLAKDRDVTQRLGLSGHRYVREYFTPQQISRQYYRLIQRAVVKNADLYRATQNHEFEVFYQPIVHLGNGRIMAMEALLRWHHPDRGLVCPPDFLAAAEETGMIIPIGWQALEQIGAQLGRWRQDHPELNLRVTINLSSGQFFHPELLPRLDQMLANHGLQGDQVILEIKETTLMEDTAATTGILMQLQARQIQVCVDEFGGSSASLSFLHRFPISLLKIGPALISRLDIDSTLGEWLASLVVMCADLKVVLIAQGVETAFQHRRVRELGITYSQGFGFSKPIAAKGLTPLLNHPNPFAFLMEPLPTSSAAPAHDSPVVLIIDDDRSLRSLLKMAVTQSGYRALEASNGQQGLELYRQARPDLVLLDALMPEMDGFVCCQQLRALAAASNEASPEAAGALLIEAAHVPILMITALDDDASVEQAFNAGATDYITKPINWAILKQRLKRQLG